MVAEVLVPAVWVGQLVLAQWAWVLQLVLGY
jgi:hypothetical protein